ncbi:MAG: hypothetical protein EPO09_21070 [Aquabacterium sp.]|uniref:hypothetical protein n=1 Tax=Aquabacterium sp. TaxID=1872578 RepID=UPI00121D27F7|nr:hypothetical protein [Aquabacterium sp.]TAK84227.1 MAG: hypothetical protein EPO09_21070 [Aquabacterium sp.]
MNALTLLVTSTSICALISFNSFAQATEFGISTRDEDRNCYVFPTLPHVDLLKKIDPTQPAIESNLISIGKDELPAYQAIALDKRACQQNELDSNQKYIKHIGNTWTLASHFIQESELDRIDTWNTRYLFRLTDPIYRGTIELSKREREIEASRSEIDAFQKKKIIASTIIFTKNGGIYIPETKSLWKMQLTPHNKIVAIDLSKKYLPVILDLTPHCERTQSEVICKINEGKETLKDSNALVVTATSNSPKPAKFVVGVVGRNYISINHRPFSAHATETRSDLVIAPTMTSPIRPLFFERKVLFTSDAKPNVNGRYRSSDLLNERICVADCPNHIKLQADSEHRD